MPFGLPSRPQGPFIVVGASIVVVLVAGVTSVVFHVDEERRPRAAVRLVTPTTSTVVNAASSAPATALPAQDVGPTAPPTYLTSTVAQAVVPSVPVFGSPTDPEPQQVLENPQPSGAPLVFLVNEQGPEWLDVLLPVRPNGSRGWVRRADVNLTQHAYDIVVELRAHRLTLFNRGEQILQEPVGIGTASTPTAGGIYYVKELLQPPDPNTVYGTYAYGLSGFSNVVTSFDGGEGVIGLHGTNDPSGLGKDVSAGCIRMDNQVINRLAGMLPLGTPVEIRGVRVTHPGPVPTRRVWVTVTLVAFAASLVAGCSDSTDSAATSSASTTGAAAGLPPATFAELAPLFEPDVAPLGLRLTRASLTDIRTRAYSKTGTHLALYVEPTSAWLDSRYVETIVPLTRALAPALFARWPQLESFDVCQEPLPDVDNRPEPAPITTVDMTRQASARIDWDRADLVTLAVASGQANGFRMSVSDALAQEPTMRAALAAAAPTTTGPR